MKTAIGYARKSRKDQSNFSVPGQKDFIADYCVKQGYAMKEVFADDGRSASTFDRPDWAKLEAFGKKHHREIDFLVVCKYDRFSRNASQGLEMIETLERKYNIVILSVMESIPLPPDSPYFFKLRAQMLVDAEYELRVIKDRTIFGIYNGLKSGRHVHQAPYGYMKVKDDENKSNIDISPVEAEKVKKLFMACYMGASISELNTYGKLLGIPLQGKSAIHRLLNRPTYAGLIQLPAYKTEPAKIIKGTFPAIISEAIYYRVQDLLNVGKPRQQEDERFPLRGVLKCHCGKPLSAAFSKGKSKYYPYYKCAYHAGANHSATSMHNQFDDVLFELSLTDAHIDYTLSAAKAKLKSQVNDRSLELRAKSAELKKVLDELESLEEKYLRNKVNEDTYNRWYMKLSTQRVQLQLAVDNLSKDKSGFWKTFEELSPKLKDIHCLYHGVDLQTKKNFVRLVFDDSLYYEKPLFRTPFLHPIFLHNRLKLKEKGLLVTEALLKDIPSRVVSGTAVEHIETLIYWLSMIG